jgi:hypothetical protein
MTTPTQVKRPTARHISTERSTYGGLHIIYEINGQYFEHFRYFFYTKPEAERLARQEARQIADSYFIEA